MDDDGPLEDRRAGKHRAGNGEGGHDTGERMGGENFTIQVVCVFDFYSRQIILWRPILSVFTCVTLT